MNVCMYVWMLVFVCMYVCMYVDSIMSFKIGVYIPCVSCVYVYMYECESTHVCMCVCMYVHLYALRRDTRIMIVFIYLIMYVCMSLPKWPNAGQANCKILHMYTHTCASYCKLPEKFSAKMDTRGTSSLWTAKSQRIHTHTHIYTYMHTPLQVARELLGQNGHTQNKLLAKSKITKNTHTHIHAHIHVHIYIHAHTTASWARTSRPKWPHAGPAPRE
jgi:hypothetical protein